MKLNTTRTEREEYLSDVHSGIDNACLIDAYRDCNTLEDECDGLIKWVQVLRENANNLRAELKSARRVIAKYKIADQCPPDDTLNGGYAYVAASEARDTHEEIFGACND